jgi:hypothetical protein
MHIDFCGLFFARSIIADSARSATQNEKAMRAAWLNG